MIALRVGLTMEFSGTVTLIVLEILNLMGVLRRITEAFTLGWVAGPHTHAHPHGHGAYVHSHAHGHEPTTHGHGEGEVPIARLDQRFGQLGIYHLVRPLVVGLVHGFAGSAGVALLVLATIRHPLGATGYLLVFGVGATRV